MEKSRLKTGVELLKFADREMRKRDSDTMSDAIAMSSPSGRMSKRSKQAAMDRLTQALFGVNESELTIGFIKGKPKPPTPAQKRSQMLSYAAELRRLSAAGMQRRKLTKEAERLEAEAEKIEVSAI